MTAFAYSFWMPTFWYLIGLIILFVWGSRSEELAILFPYVIGIVWSLIYIVWLIIWVCMHWSQIHGVHVINIVN